MRQLIYELAAIAGIDPGPRSLREIMWAVEAKQKDDWDHTAAILAMQSNTAFGRKKRDMIKPQQIHPFRRRRQTIRLTKEQSRERLNTAMGLKKRKPGRNQ